MPPERTIFAHNHEKQYPLEAGRYDEFLYTLGIINREGKVLAPMQKKYRQINEFLRIIELTVPGREQGGRPLSMVDCGCGSAYLTFAAFHYLNHLCGTPAQLTGIDRNPEVVEKSNCLRDQLGWDGISFTVANIVDYNPGTAVDVVMSLHACDTATDEAIARAINWDAKVILVAPCCQHELHHQIQAPVFLPLLRHGVLRERLADLLTDTFRALILRIMGYQTRVIEFVSPEHTSKNLLIRAEKETKPGESKFIAEYLELKSFWKVTPVLESLVGPPLTSLLPPV